MFEKSTYTMVLRADSPIAHHSETFGNTAIIMTEKIRQSDGTFANVPIITGDTMRHGLREAAAMAFLDAAGLLDEWVDGGSVASIKRDLPRIEVLRGADHAPGVEHRDEDRIVAGGVATLHPFLSNQLEPVRLPKFGYHRQGVDQVMRDFGPLLTLQASPGGQTRRECTHSGYPTPFF